MNTAMGGGYGINRSLKAESHLGTAVPPHAGGGTVVPGLRKQMPGSPKTGYSRPKAKSNA
jgi:hypothetical protein